MKTTRSRIILITVLAIASLVSLLPRTVTERALDPATGQVTEHSVRRIPIDLGLDLSGGVHLALELDPSQPAVDDCADAIEGAARVIRNRISEFGTAAPIVQVAAGCRLIVELPGERDPVRARDIVQQTAFLEFRLVDDQDRFDPLARFLEASIGESGLLVRGSMPGEYMVPDRRSDEIEEALASAPRRILPSDTEVRWGAESDDRFGEVWRPFYVVDADPVITGEDLEGATAGHDPMTSQPQVRFELDNRGGRAFADATGRNIGGYLAIVLDGRVQGAPAMIRERIRSIGSIELPNRTMQEAGDLALVLRAGALPAPLHVVEQSTVGPSLGADSIAAGLRTSVLAVGFVMLAMVLYYRMSGLLAVCALGLYLLLSLGGLAALGFTLTLPGIAGFAVAIGMAVDANVLIFERIREEQNGARTVRAAVDRGFRNALSAIVDSNVTTALTALILYRVGTDSVKGFAVTLLIGICASMFAAVFVTRTFFTVWLSKRGRVTGPKFWKIGSLASASVDFMGARRWVLSASGAFIAVGLLMYAFQGMSYGIDFTGGTLLHIQTDEVVSSDDVRAALTAGALDASAVQSYGSERDFLIRTRPTGDLPDVSTSDVLEHARATLDGEFGVGGYEVRRGEAVNPQVGGELQQRAGAAIGLSFLSTLAYLAARFDRRLGLAAVVTTAHDILATLAFMRWLDIEVSLITVAGVLTVIGYSLNDTIVIFDRVRENRRASPGSPLRDVLNRSIGQTLPRTMLTTGTTLVAALLLATLGGATIRPLALVMSFGIAVGTLSSIFVASPTLLWLSQRSRVPAGVE
ncbi:MAG: protein translocase subunit SecD [Gemmatimonadota bacterium]